MSVKKPVDIQLHILTGTVCENISSMIENRKKFKI